MRSLCTLSIASVLCTGVLADPVSQERGDALRHLLHQDCGSCHGLRLTGGLGPALTPEALAGKPRDYLIATVREGRPGTPMPPWKGQLSDNDIAWLIDSLTATEVNE